MDNAQLPRRKAAIKATTQLADISSSSDENDPRHEDNDYAIAQRVNGAKTKTNGKKAKTHRSKRSGVGSVDLAMDPSTTGARKRKGGAWNVTGPSRKRQRGATYVGSIPQVGGGVDDDSDLTPLSSDDEPEEDRTSQRLPADFPLQLTPVTSKSHHDKPSGSKADTHSLLGISDLDDDDDSDDLPDVGMVLSQQQDVSTSKAPNHNVSTRKPKSRTQAKRTRDTPCIFGSSPAPPTVPPSSLPLSLYGVLGNEDVETELDVSDYSDIAEFSDDSDLDLDGELCLARAKSGDTFYWPAKVLQVKKTAGKGKGKQKKMFHVMFLDKKEKDIPRNWFYTSSQEEFRTCSIGQFESSHIEVINDIDEELRPSNDLHAPRCHSTTPSQPLPTFDIPSLPLSGPAYCDLSLRQQFVHVVPVLKAIMAEEYTWGLRRHELFIKGGTSRLKLLNEGGMRGAMDARSVDELLIFVEQWSLGCRGRDFIGDDDQEITGNVQIRDTARDDGVNVEVSNHMNPTTEVVPKTVSVEVYSRTGGSEGSDTANDPPTNPSPSDIANQPSEEHLETEPIPLTLPSTQVQLQTEGQPLKGKPPRQHGSPAYEKLSPLDKVQYCIEVLLPEAINQILLWRTGERKSVDVMWDDVEEEKRLHERGEQLLRETDWVMDVMRLRRALERGRGREGRGERIGTDVVKNKKKDLRRTRSGRVGSIVGSYKE